MKVLICGAKGFVGKHLYNSLKDDFDVVGVDKDDFDITKENEVKNYFHQHEYDCVILTAANKNVRELEENPQKAYEVNTKPVEYFLKYNRCRLIFLSSDYVFDGQAGNYKDSDEPNPVTVYGKTKANAENLLIRSGKDFLIIRTAAILGKGTPFFDWLTDELKTANSVKMYKDSYFSPTCIGFLCDVIKQSIKDDMSGKLLNVVQEKRLSRYELGLVFKKITNSNCKIEPENCEFKDLSLVQSDYVKSLGLGELEEYLEKELKNV